MVSYDQMKATGRTLECRSIGWKRLMGIFCCGCRRKTGNERFLQWNDQVTIPKSLESGELCGHVQDTLVPFQDSITKSEEFICHVYRFVDQLGKTCSAAMWCALEDCKPLESLTGISSEP